MKKEEKYNLHELQIAMMKYPPKWGHYIMNISPPSMYGKSLVARWIKEECPDIKVISGKPPHNLKGNAPTPLEIVMKYLSGNYEEEGNKREDDWISKKGK